MEHLLELGGAWLARACVVYGAVFLLLPSFSFAYVPLLVALIWAVIPRSSGLRRWRLKRDAGFRRGWLAIEVVFGLINPVIYLAILSPTILSQEGVSGQWLPLLHSSAWILLAAFWAMRLFGGAFGLRCATSRRSVLALLFVTFGCLLLHTAKDARFLFISTWNQTSLFTFVLNVLRLAPLYLIPAVLLWEHIETALHSYEPEAGGTHGLFLLRERPSRFAVAAVASLVLVTVTMAGYRRSDAAVRKLVSAHGESIRAAAASHDVDPKVIAAIVYVTHRDQLSPFRGALERLLVAAWARDLRQEFGVLPPDKTGEGADQNPLLKRALDISVGLAQIKPRTAQTASVLATGRRPGDLPRPQFFSYMDAEPLRDAWSSPVAVNTAASAPIPVPAGRQIVSELLLDDRSNLATCALIHSLYQGRWEAAKREWSIRHRPDILATLYQIGFARSKPHGAPRSNAFGRRVGQVYAQPWLAELFAPPRDST